MPDLKTGGHATPTFSLLSFNLSGRQYVLTKVYKHLKNLVSVQCLEIYYSNFLFQIPEF